MNENNVIRVRDIPLLDWAVYLTLAVFASMGIIFLNDVVEKGIVVVALAAFGTTYILGYRRAQTSTHLHIYFFIQTLIVAGLYMTFRTADLFGFLFFLLVIQVMVALSTPVAVGWVLIFFLTASLGSFLRNGSAGLANILFNIPAYFLVTVFAYVFRAAEIARRQHQKLLEELRATQAQLEELAITKERTRLARELHDSLGHRLTVAVVQLEGAQRLISSKPDQASQIITTMRAELKSALADLRLTVSAMRSPITKHQPLESALLALSESFQQNTGIATHFVAIQHFPTLPEPYNLAFYRAAQEGLTNIQRHAGAQTAWIQINADSTNFELIVADDGQGFGISTDQNHSAGLLGLRERAEQLGGQIRTGEREGGGARLSFTIPAPENGGSND